MTEQVGEFQIQDNLEGCLNPFNPTCDQDLGQSQPWLVRWMLRIRWGSASLLVLLDLSPAFNIFHQVLSGQAAFCMS